MSGEPVDPNDEEERAKAAERLLGGRDLCRAVRCKKKIGADRIFFCADHWRMIPSGMKHALLIPKDAVILGKAIAEAVAEVRRIELERADR